MALYDSVRVVRPVDLLSGPITVVKEVSLGPA
jgi:hypothetical protein